MEEVAKHQHMHSTKHNIGLAFEPAQALLELEKQTRTSHAPLIQNEHATRAPALAKSFCDLPGPARRCIISATESHRTVHRHATKIGGRCARRSGAHQHIAYEPPPRKVLNALNDAGFACATTALGHAKH